MDTFGEYYWGVITTIDTKCTVLSDIVIFKWKWILKKLYCALGRIVMRRHSTNMQAILMSDLVPVGHRIRVWRRAWSDFFVDNPASGRVMEKCGFRDTGEINYCSKLQVGNDRPVKVMKLMKG